MIKVEQYKDSIFVTDHILIPGPESVFRVKELCLKPGNKEIFSYQGEVVPGSIKEINIIPRQELNQDWVLVVILLGLLLIARMGKIFGKFIMPIFYAGVNGQAMKKLFGTRNSLSIKAGIHMDIVFFLVIGLFMYQLLEYFQPFPWKLSGLLLYVLTFFIVGGWLIYKFIIHFLAGIISGRSSFFRENFHSLTVFNKISGVLILPVVTGIAYVSEVTVPFFIYAGLFILAIVYLLRVFRLNILFLSKRISLFYSILYLCALEILPVLVMVRLLFPLS